jgi:hypothetical protein
VTVPCKTCKDQRFVCRDLIPCPVSFCVDNRRPCPDCVATPAPPIATRRDRVLEIVRDRLASARARADVHSNHLVILEILDALDALADLAAGES